jgi:hypothetical protein
VFTSLLGQFAVHICFLMYMQRAAHEIMPQASSGHACVRPPRTP